MDRSIVKHSEHRQQTTTVRRKLPEMNAAGPRVVRISVTDAEAHLPGSRHSSLPGSRSRRTLARFTS
ncbi:hypothetical protein HYC85_010687 [Camellia sinensis]|uniref:Uncharacterized protein n=1 Tax=Camellia sinensis TaxID=4442 RepID=A0A7J7HIS0_CAMSI|nr:hypothetical protein HYC85_010687 [Camellia sinensis]